MLFDRPKTEITRELTEQARQTWGQQRTNALQVEIGKVANWISLIAPYQLEMEADEPDFLVAPATEQGGL